MIIRHGLQTNCCLVSNLSDHLNTYGSHSTATVFSNVIKTGRNDGKTEKNEYQVLIKITHPSRRHSSEGTNYEHFSCQGSCQNI